MIIIKVTFCRLFISNYQLSITLLPFMKRALQRAFSLARDLTYQIEAASMISDI